MARTGAIGSYTDSGPHVHVPQDGHEAGLDAIGREHGPQDPLVQGVEGLAEVDEQSVDRAAEGSRIKDYSILANLIIRTEGSKAQKRSVAAGIHLRQGTENRWQAITGRKNDHQGNDPPSNAAYKPTRSA